MPRMVDVYNVLITVDLPDAATGSLHWTTEELRAMLERTPGNVTVVLHQFRLELALDQEEQAVGSIL